MLQNVAFFFCFWEGKLYVHISKDEEFISTKINQNLLNNASPATVQKIYAECASAQLKSKVVLKQQKGCSQWFKARDKGEDASPSS